MKKLDYLEEYFVPKILQEVPGWYSLRNHGETADKIRIENGLAFESKIEATALAEAIIQFCKGEYKPMTEEEFYLIEVMELIEEKLKKAIEAAEREQGFTTPSGQVYYAGQKDLAKELLNLYFGGDGKREDVK